MSLSGNVPVYVMDLLDQFRLLCFAVMVLLKKNSIVFFRVYVCMCTFLLSMQEGLR